MSNIEQLHLDRERIVRLDGNVTLIKPPGSNEKRLTEDEIARAHLGDRGVPGEPFPIKNMTPERKKKTPLCGLDPGHTA